MTAADPILNWFALNERVTTSGQPTEAQFTAVRDAGTKAVINLGLHTHEKALADEAATVAALGMTYVHIPVDFAAPTEADYEAFCEAMARHQHEQVHIHCIMNARVTAFLYRYQQQKLGRTESQARAFMDQVWRPGGVWAAFIGDASTVDLPDRYAGHHY